MKYKKNKTEKLLLPNSAHGGLRDDRNYYPVIYDNYQKTTSFTHQNLIFNFKVIQQWERKKILCLIQT
jgi:hypothetical protein